MLIPILLQFQLGKYCYFTCYVCYSSICFWIYFLSYTC